MPWVSEKLIDGFWKRSWREIGLLLPTFFGHLLCYGNLKNDVRKGCFDKTVFLVWRNNSLELFWSFASASNACFSVFGFNSLVLVSKMSSVTTKSVELPLSPSLAEIQAQKAINLDLLRKKLLDVDIKDLVPMLVARHVLRSYEMMAVYSQVYNCC